MRHDHADRKEVTPPSPNTTIQAAHLINPKSAETSTCVTTSARPNHTKTRPGMHELPKELGNSLRSFRNSVHRHSGQYAEYGDLEKRVGEDEEEETKRRVDETSSDLILVSEALHADQQLDLRTCFGNESLQHPTLSRQAIGLNFTTHEEASPNPEQPTKRPLSSHSSRRSHHAYLPPETPASKKRPLLTAPKIADPDPASDRLDDDPTPLKEEDFYKLMGMRPPKSKVENPKNLGMRNGLYARIVSKYEYINRKYRIFDVLTYVLLVLQLLLGAAFIVLGSITGMCTAHISIAILGAISTVAAGALALMKGQGLPNRLHQMRDDLHNVKFEAEELYWDVAAGREVLYRDIRKLREDYLRVMEDGRRNHPDTWTAATQQLVAVQSAGKPKVVLGQPGKLA